MMVNKVNQITDALQISVYCKRWWKKLSKDLSGINATNEQKIIVFMGFVKGFVIEGLKVCDDDSDYGYISNIIQECALRVINRQYD